MPTAATRTSPRSHASTSRLSSGDARIEVGFEITKRHEHHADSLLGPPTRHFADERSVQGFVRDAVGCEANDTQRKNVLDASLDVHAVAAGVGFRGGCPRKRTHASSVRGEREGSNNATPRAIRLGARAIAAKTSGEL